MRMRCGVLIRMMNNESSCQFLPTTSTRFESYESLPHVCDRPTTHYEKPFARLRQTNHTLWKTSRTSATDQSYLHNKGVHMQNKMILTEKDSDLFYELWFPVLDYVNKKFIINTSIGNISTQGQYDPNDMFPIATKLWEDADDIIDAYLLDKGDSLCIEHRNIVESWKHRISGQFILERHLKKGSVLISTDGNNNVYLVKGIKTSLEDMFFMFPIPMYLWATLLPFKNDIISDGLIMTPPQIIYFGGNIKRELKNTYMNAKNTGKIITSL